MTYNVLMGTLNPTHSLTHSLTHSNLAYVSNCKNFNLLFLIAIFSV